MNALNIANILIGKRREKGITQEELAKYLGVSNGAVSKWEKRLSYPDITLLPKLAAYFNISVDELIGYSPQLTREDTWKLCKKISAEFVTKPFDAWLEECKKAINDYFSCFPLLYHMAVLLVNHYPLAETQEKQEEVLEEARALCARIVSESSDALLVKNALYIQSYCSIVLCSPDDVFTLLGESLRMPDLAEDTLISQAYELAGNKAKAKEISQCGMYQHLMLLLASTLTYAALSEDSFETARTAHRRLMELIRMYDVHTLDPNTTAKAYLLGAELYCKHGHRETALEWLEKYAELCVTLFFPFKLQGDAFFTDIDQWLEDSELGALLPVDDRMVKQNMLHSLAALPSLTALHDDPRYKRVVQKITDFINAE